MKACLSRIFWLVLNENGSLVYTLRRDLSSRLGTRTKEFNIVVNNSSYHCQM